MSGDDDQEADFQKLETAHTIAELLKTQSGLREGQDIVLDLFFLPGPEADADGALQRLRMFGYLGEIDEDGTLSLQTPTTQLSLEGIWLQHI